MSVSLCISGTTLFILIFVRTNFCTFAQKNPFACKNLHRIYAEKGYVQNLIHTKIISFHLIYFEPFQKLLFWFKGNIYFFIRFKKNWHAQKLIRAKKTYIAVVQKLVHAKKFSFAAQKLIHAKISTNKVYIIWLWFLVHMCKMMISPAIFFILYKFWCFRFLGGQKGKNDPKLPISVCHALYPRDCRSYHQYFWHTGVK